MRQSIHIDPGMKALQRVKLLAKQTATPTSSRALSTSPTMAAHQLDINTKIKLKSGHEIPQLGYGRSHLGCKELLCDPEHSMLIWHNVAVTWLASFQHMVCSPAFDGADETYRCLPNVC